MQAYRVATYAAEEGGGERSWVDIVGDQLSGEKKTQAAGGERGATRAAAQKNNLQPR